MKILPKIDIKIALSILAAIILIVFLPFLKVQIAKAQFVKTLTITPPTIEKTLSPGDRVEGQLKLINDGDLPLTISVETQDYIVVDGSGTPNLLPLNTLSGKYSAASWIGVDPGKIVVEPHKRQAFSYYIQVPQDARPGGHYAAVVYKPAGEKMEASTGTGVNSQMATLFYITIKGDVVEKASVSKFLANFFNEYGPVKVFSQIKNLGDLHIRPTGTITLTNLFGQKSTYSIDARNIFPGGGYRDIETLVGKKWMFGPYTAKLSAVYGKDGNLPLVAAVTFWVIPWKIIVLVILVIALVVLGIKYMDKNKKRKEHEHKEEVKEPEPQPTQAS